MGAVLPFHLRQIAQSQIGFVNQGGGLERVAAGLTIDRPLGKPVEFVVNHRHQLIQRRLVSAAPLF